MSRRMTDAEIERILSGQAGTADLSGLSALIDRIASADATVPEPVAARHVASAVAAAREGASPFQPTTARVPRSRRRRFAASGVGRAVVAFGLVLAIAISGAFLGLLPDGAQSFAAGVARRVGLDLPDPLMPAVTTTTTTTTSTSTTSTSTPSPTTTDPSHLTPGAYSWFGTGCQGNRVQVRYEVTAEGTLRLISVSHATAKSTTRPDRIDVEFTNGAAVRIDIDDDGSVEVENRTDCDDDDEGDDVDDDDDGDNSGSGSGSSDDDEDDDDDDHSGPGGGGEDDDDDDGDDDEPEDD